MSCVITRSGLTLDLLDPDPNCIKLVDIASGLSRVNRFNGQISTAYNVAQHSLECARYGRNDGENFGLLMHDAAEAYMGDMATPLKNLIPKFKEIEDNLLGVICDKYNAIIPETCKRVDRIMLAREVYAFSYPQHGYWDSLMSEYDTGKFQSITVLSAERSAHLFLEQVRKYTNEH